MKLKQALVLGLTTAVLAIPAFAADEAINAPSLPSSVSPDQKTSVPPKKEALHKRRHKNCLTNDDAKNMEKKADLNQLNTVDPNKVVKN